MFLRFYLQIRHYSICFLLLVVFWGHRPMSIPSRAITCQAVPDVSKPADVEAEPEEPSGDVNHGEMDLIHES